MKLFHPPFWCRSALLGRSLLVAHMSVCGASASVYGWSLSDNVVSLGGFLGGAQDEVRLRPVADWDRDGAQGVIAFTSFTREQQALGGLPCKWVSQSGTEDRDYGRTNLNHAARYDFLCKGGNWATVSLMLDRAPGQSAALSRVRLLWREWPQRIQAGQGDQAVAAQFLEHVISRVVPADLADEVQAAFFKTRAKSWWSGKVLRITYAADDNRTHRVHRLEITGLATQMTDPASLLADAQMQGQARLPQRDTVPVYRQPTVIAPANIPTADLPVPYSGGLTTPPPGTATGGTTTGGAGTPTIFDTLPPSRSGAAPMPVPATPATATGLTVPANTLPFGSQGRVPAGMPASGTLVPATAADVVAQPDPDSPRLPVAPPRVSDTMVPDAADTVWGRAAAPSNFDMYNRAEALTREFEVKSRPKANDGLKVLPATVAPVQRSSGLAVSSSVPVPTGRPAVPSMLRPGTPLFNIGVTPVNVTPTGVPGPSLNPVDTPTVGMPPVEAAAPVSEGLGMTPRNTPATNQLAPDWVAMDNPSPDLSLDGGRPLPQLKFVPKAQPLVRPDQVIRFEDEGSQL